MIVGGSATLVDLVLFQVLAVIITGSPLVAKGISFLFSTIIKYGGNKYWTFPFDPAQGEQKNIYKEIFSFFVITCVALVIDIYVFNYLTKTVGPQFGLSKALWTPLCVVAAQLSSAVVSFSGYKFFVFKK